MEERDRGTCMSEREPYVDLHQAAVGYFLTIDAAAKHLASAAKSGDSLLRLPATDAEQTIHQRCARPASLSQDASPLESVCIKKETQALQARNSARCLALCLCAVPDSWPFVPPSGLRLLFLFTIKGANANRAQQPLLGDRMCDGAAPGKAPRGSGGLPCPACWGRHARSQQRWF